MTTIDASSLYEIVCMVLSIPTIVYIVAYSIPQVYLALRPVPNLKKRYDAEWALVTGAGSGIGRALSFKLASQGLNVVLVSLDDEFLKGTTKELQERYPQLQFRPVGCNFSPGVDYMSKIREATKDISVQIVFNNAGFAVTGFFDQAPAGKLLANVECNSTALVQISKHFCSQWVSSQKRACLVFTSSVAGYIPTPFAASYGATKAFCSQLAACLYIELKGLGIDVCAVHPSPVATRFYDKVDHKIELMEAAQKTAVPPETLPNQIFQTIGAFPFRDLGGMAMGTRMGTFFLPYNFFTWLFGVAAPYLPDYQKHNKTRLASTTTKKSD